MPMSTRASPASVSSASSNLRFHTHRDLPLRLACWRAKSLRDLHPVLNLTQALNLTLAALIANTGVERTTECAKVESFCRLQVVRDLFACD